LRIAIKDFSSCIKKFNSYSTNLFHVYKNHFAVRYINEFLKQY
jgi:hypothetical protein